MYTNNFHLDIIGVEMQNQTRMGCWVGGVGVGKCVSKENPKSNLDLDLGFVKKDEK